MAIEEANVRGIMFEAVSMPSLGACIMEISSKRLRKGEAMQQIFVSLTFLNCFAYHTLADSSIYILPLCLVSIRFVGAVGVSDGSYSDGGEGVGVSGGAYCEGGYICPCSLKGQILDYIS